MSGVLVVGDVIDDVLVRPSGPIAPDTDTPSRIERLAGGSAANTACWLAREGVPTTLVATVHREDVERHGGLLAAHGVTTRLKGSDRPTGTIVVLSQGEQRAMLTDRGANVETVPDDVSEELLTAHDVLLVTGHVVAGDGDGAGWAELLAHAAAAGLLVAVAPGSAAMVARFGAERFRRLIAPARLLVASGEEARLLTGEADARRAAALLGRDSTRAVVTSGAEGSVVAEDGAVVSVPAVRTTPVDVTGAGDAFAAGLLAALLHGAPLRQAAAAGAALAARAVSMPGARPR